MNKRIGVNKYFIFFFSYFTVHFCEWITGEPKPLASQKLLWVSPEKLTDFPFPAANTNIISELHKHLCIGYKIL